MTRFDRAELLSFLRALDRNLERPTTIVLIGGAAAAIEYHAGTKTADFDVYEGLTDDVSLAAENARKETGLAIAIGTAAVADLPINYEDRLRQGRGLRLENLTVIVPDKYDLALSKVVRGYQHDIDAIAAIHRRRRLARKTLVERFESEMTAAVTDPHRVRLNMIVLVARLYGIGEARKLAARWGVPSPRE